MATVPHRQTLGGSVGTQPNNALQRTHSPVTSLAEERKRRATRRAAERERWADKGTM